MFNILLTVYLWLVALLALLITFPIAILLYPFLDQKSFSRMCEVVPGYLILYSMLIPNFWTLKIVDRRKDKSWNNKRYVVVANHLSFIDSLVTITLPLKKKFMIARIYTKIPIFGWLVKMAGFIPVDRHQPNNRSDPKNSGVLRAIKNMNDGASFLIYPEGKRSLTYQLDQFKSGAFVIAKETNVPILPITLKGTKEALDFGGKVGFSDITITIGEPFYVENIPDSIKKARDFIQSNL